MKIEMLVPALSPAGMEMVVAILTRGLARRGYDVGVTCLVYKGAVAETLEREGHRVMLVRTPGIRTNFVPADLQRWLNERKPDVVHIHTGAWLKGSRASHLARVPRVVLTMHGLDGTRPWYERFMDRWAAHYAHAVVPVSDAFVPYVRNLGVPSRRICVITNGIDTQLFRPGERSGRLRESFGLDENDFVIGHVARFAPVKNHAMLIDAFAEIVRAEPSAFLALVGDGRLRADVEAHVDRLGIRSRVGFLGQAGDLHEIFRDFDVFVLPSLSEATSISMLEAMATGLPVIATAVGGNPALVGHGEAGVLIPSNDAAALKQAIVRLILMPAERARLGKAARQRVEVTHSEEHMLDAYEKLYAQNGG